jgi:hypothetical protein
VDVSKAKTVEGKATLVEGSADDTCPKTCIAEATIVITIEGDCRYAVFTPNGTDCSVAAGTVAINATTGEFCRRVEKRSLPLPHMTDLIL